MFDINETAGWLSASTSMRKLLRGLIGGRNARRIVAFVLLMLLNAKSLCERLYRRRQTCIKTALLVRNRNINITIIIIILIIITQ